ncbi:MAG: TIGR04283 family arsenosugar biosynthesis glycosyltransferase [Polyangia bacterium]
MRGPARVAVIVPVLDELRQLPALGGELGRLRDAGAEVVVVDGGSRDGTRAALDRLDLTVIGAPRGRATQMNAGARATSAPALLFLHADTRLPDGALDAVAAAIAGGAAGGCFRVRIESSDPRLAVAARIINLRSRLIPSASGDQAIFADRAAFDRIGGYRELALCEDLDFVARLSRQGRFACLDGEVATSARRWHAHGVTRTIALMWALRLGYHLGVSPRLLARWYGDAR